MIAEVIGRESALYLVGQLPRAYSPCHPSGQVILYVPKTLKLDHPLIQLLGYDKARQLVKAFGGEILQPANCADLYRDFRDKSIQKLLIEGNPPAVIAEWFGMCERHVRNIKRELPQEAVKARNLETVEA